jgi:hypothetical protein
MAVASPLTGWCAIDMSDRDDGADGADGAVRTGLSTPASLASRGVGEVVTPPILGRDHRPHMRHTPQLHPARRSGRPSTSVALADGVTVGQGPAHVNFDLLSDSIDRQ